MISATREYTAQDVIELFNGDQPHVDQLIADALNSNADVSAVIKQQIRFMDLAVEDAAELEFIANNGTLDQINARHRKQHILGMARTGDYTNYT